MQHLPHLDTWRGLAVLLVVCHHVAIRLPLAKSDLGPWLPERLSNTLNWNGYEAVLLFFVLSGFLITRRTLQRDGRPGAVDLYAFWVRRVARIAPPLLTVVGVLVVMHLLGVKHHTIDLGRQSLELAVLSALTFWLNVYEARTGYLPGGWDVLWSLSIEELFYLAFPWLMRLMRSDWALALVLTPFALAMPQLFMAVEAGITREKATLPCMAAIAAGVVTALAERRAPPAPRVDAAARGLGAVAVLAGLGFADKLWALVKHEMLLVLVLGMCAVVFGARSAVPWRISEPLRALGRASYEIYLTHMFVVFAVVELFAVSGLGEEDGAWAYPLALVGSYGLGVAFLNTISEPANRHLRKRWLAAPPPA